MSWWRGSCRNPFPNDETIDWSATVSVAGRGENASEDACAPVMHTNTYDSRNLTGRVIR